MKKTLSMFLALCMVVTLLPVTAMAEEIHTSIGTSWEITNFVPLAETEKTRALGTSIQDLELPETLTATVRTALPPVEELVQDSGIPETATPTTATEPEWEETTVDIPVKWEPTPEYDPDTEGEYVFTPVITGYAVSAEPPQITVTVGVAIMGHGLVSPLAGDTYNIWVGGIQVTEENKDGIAGSGITGIVTYDASMNTLTLTNANITANYSNTNGTYGIYANQDLNIQLVGDNAVTAADASGELESTAIYVLNNTLTILGEGSLTATGGNVNHASYGSCGISANNLTINGGTVVAKAGTSPAYNWGIYSIETPIFNGGTITATAAYKAMGAAPDLSGYVNVQISASTTNAQGGDATVITKETLASDISNYKYLTFESVVGGTITEQFNLTLGDTYYFDLSSEKDNIGTVNTALPDTTLHYVPFTYAGTVNAYSLDSTMATTETYANENKSDRSLFVGDNVIGVSVSWDSLDSADLIFGKTFDTHYKLRSLSAGSEDVSGIGRPNTNEWDQIITKSDSIDNTTGWIKNWSGKYSCTQDTSILLGAPIRAVRGYSGARNWGNYGSHSYAVTIGFRPALEVLDPDTLTSDGLKAVTLNLNGGSLKESTANINIICAGDEFTAPSGEGLTAPSSKTFDGWKDINSTATYAVGATVPNTVTGLTAQWEALYTDVVQIGSTGYPTLQAAVNAAADGETITLLSDITAPNTGRLVNTTKATAFTLDFKGHTITGPQDYDTIFYNGTGTLTLADSVGGGGIEAAAASAINQFNGAVIINGGVFRTTANLTSTIYVSSGTLTVNGGTITKNGANNSAIWGLGTSVIKIHGGTIEAPGSGTVGIYDSSSAIQPLTVDVQSGYATIKGEIYAMNKAPTIASGTQVTASTVYSGSPTTTYSAGSIGSYKYLKFEPDTTSSVITSVYTTTTNGTYTMGDTLSFTVIFNENVIVTGEPSLSLTIGSETKQAAYVSGSGTPVLSFCYAVQAGDSDPDGISVGASLNANGGTLRDSAGNDAVLTLNSVGSTSDILVDTSAAPYITGHPSPQTVNEGQSATFSVTANVTGLTYKWQVNTGSGFTNISNGTFYSGANTSTLTITVATAEMNGYQYRAVVSGTREPATTSNPATLTVNAAPTYTISGTIKGSDTGRGVYSASVWLKSGSSNVGIPVLTDVNGAYTISNVSAGTYSIEVGSPGYNSGTISSVTVSASVTGKDLTLTSILIFTPVTDITMTNATSVQVGSDLTLTGIVFPATATNQSIVWSIESANGTGATIVGSTFRATSAGTATVKATVANGSTTSSDYTKTFNITVTAAPVVPGALIGTATISNTAPRIGNRLTGSLVGGNNTGTLTYVWKAGGTQVGTSSEYIVDVTDLGKTITLEITSNVETGTVTSVTTAVAKKSAPAAPSAPTLVSKTHNTVTLTANTAYEFSKDGTNWQTIPIFTGLTANTAYTFYQKVTETADTEASVASEGFSVTTNSNSSGGSGGGSGSDGGSSTNDNSNHVIVIPPAADKPNDPTQGEIKVPGTADGKGNITVNITNKTVTDAFDKALADAKKNGNEKNGITVVLRVDTGSKTGSNVTVNLPKTVQDIIIAKKIVNTIVVVDNPDIIIGMDLATVQEINKQAKSDVNITATRADSSKLTGDAKKAIGSRPVFDLKVNYGSGKAVSSFGSGSVSVTIPYILGANEKAGNVQAVYVDAKGKVHWLTNSVYDSVEQVLRFSTNHFSTYGIGYKQTNTAFTDIADHWAKEDIEFVVSRGLFSGISNTTFSPNTAMTRGMFVTALGRLANADVSDYAKSSFSDVKNDAYYMGYIELASKNNIVNGVGSGKFAPDQSITREQMAVIMQNYAKVIGFTLPKVHGENTFADNAKISAYAKDAVKQMQLAGVICGKNSNLFDPQGTATRAEASAVLRRFVELAISSDTMQGWTRNDSGQ